MSGYVARTGWRIARSGPRGGVILGASHVCTPDAFPVLASMDVPVDGPDVLVCPSCRASLTYEDLGLKYTSPNADTSKE